MRFLRLHLQIYHPNSKLCILQLVMFPPATLWWSKYSKHFLNSRIQTTSHLYWSFCFCLQWWRHLWWYWRWYAEFELLLFLINKFAHIQLKPGDWTVFSLFFQTASTTTTEKYPALPYILFSCFIYYDFIIHLQMELLYVSL